MSPLTALPAISLDELVAEAALLTRVDRKYLLQARELEQVMTSLPSGTRALEIDERRTFGYASTYFDTADRASYHGTATARRRRWKVRTRSYLLSLIHI